MKKLVLLFGVTMFLVTSSLNAKTLPAVAAKLPTEFKQEVLKKINYPAFERNNLIEGMVCLKVMLNEDSKVELIDLNATNIKLGEYVKKEMSDFYVTSTNLKVGEVYYLKIKFDLNMLE